MRYVVAILSMLALLAAWVAVQSIARRFARRHPEFGEYREERGGCCGACSGSSCSRKSEGGEERPRSASQGRPEAP